MAKKYFDAEKLKAEIDKLIDDAPSYDDSKAYLFKVCSIIDSLQQEQTEEHPDNFTSFEWLVGRLMFRGCDLWGMTDGEDDNGVVTKLIKDKAVEMMELLERKLDILAEPTEGIKGNLEEILSNVDLEKELDKFYGMYRKGGQTYDIKDGEECADWKEMCNPDFEIALVRHFYELGRKGGKNYE